MSDHDNNNPNIKTEPLTSDNTESLGLSIKISLIKNVFNFIYLISRLTERLKIKSEPSLQEAAKQPQTSNAEVTSTDKLASQDQPAAPAVPKRTFVPNLAVQRTQKDSYVFNWLLQT
jgi:hypothetical protein